MPHVCEEVIIVLFRAASIAAYLALLTHIVKWGRNNKMSPADC